MKLKVDNYQDLSIPVTVRVSSAASTLSATTNTAVNNVSWGVGSAPPTYTIKLTSSNEPISWSAWSIQTLTVDQSALCIAESQFAIHRVRHGCNRDV